MAATNKRGVFSLETVLERQSDNHWSKIPEVFRYVNSLETPANAGGPAYGYAAGGFPGPNTIIDRIDYASDTSTASPKGNLSSGKGWGEATGDTSYAYVGGGNPDGTKVDRIDYSSDTSTASPKGNLSQARYYLSAAGNTSYGWWAGGAVGGGEGSTIDRKDYASDTTTNSVRGTLTVAKRLYASGTGNLSYGYFSGGATTNSGGYVSTVERVEYSNDASTASPKGPLTSATGYSSATGNSDYGYVGGGNPASTPNRSTIDRIDFGNDTATTLARSNLPYSGGYGTATGSSDFGYWIGSSARKSQVNRLDYSNDTATTVTKGPLSANKYSPAGSFSGQTEGLSSDAVPIVPATRTETVPAGGPAYAFFAGGGPAAPSAMALTSVERIDFSNDTAAPTAAGNLADKQHFNVAVGNQSYGYNCGGKGGPSVGAYPGTRVQRIDYANDSATAAFKGNLTVRRQSAAATGSNSYGYIIGGFNQDIPGPISTVDRIDYADDTSTALTRGTLPIAKSNTMSTGNQSYGYSAGGEPAPAPAYTFTSVDRVDYASDTSTAAPKGNMHRKGAKGAATGNANYGWFALGDSPSQSTYITRIDYGNDTATSSPKGPLNVAKKRMGATGNGDYGYWSSGAPQPINTKVSRVDYSNDTATAVDKGPMTAGRYALGGLSSQAYGLPSPSSQIVDKGADGYTTSSSGPAYGYWAGGEPGLTTVTRLDFGNDTATQAPKGNLVEESKSFGGTASTSYAYFYGGSSPGISTISRIDFANDSANATPKGPLASVQKYHTAVGNNNYGYSMGGETIPGSDPASTVYRLDYGNDTATPTVKGNLSRARKSVLSAAGNQSYGYAAGGRDPGATSVVDRMDYSNDTSNMVVKGPLTSARYYAAASGNASYGYFGPGFGNSQTQNETRVDRLDYSNDTATTSLKAALSPSKQVLWSNWKYFLWIFWWRSWHRSFW